MVSHRALFLTMFVACPWLTTEEAIADAFIYEGFDYPQGDLQGRSGGVGWLPGPSGSWDDRGSSNTHVVVGSLAYTDARGNQLQTSGNRAAFIEPTTPRSHRRIDTATAPAELRAANGRLGRDGSSIWMSFLFEYDTATAPTSWGGITPYGGDYTGGGDGNHRLTIGQHGPFVGNNFSFGPPGPGDFAVYNVTSDKPLSEPSLVVVRFDFYEFVGPLPDPLVHPHWDAIPGEDEIYMWINPLLDELPDEADAVYAPFRRDARASDQNPSWTFDRLRMMASNGGTGAYLDELRIGATFTDVTPFFAPTLPGDYNENGLVDAADYTVWRDNLGGSSMPNETASLGAVDQDDYAEWIAHFGTSSSEARSASAAASRMVAPEPSAVEICFLAICVVLSHARAVACHPRRKPCEP